MIDVVSIHGAGSDSSAIPIPTKTQPTKRRRPRRRVAPVGVYGLDSHQEDDVKSEKNDLITLLQVENAQLRKENSALEETVKRLELQRDTIRNILTL